MRKIIFIFLMILIANTAMANERITSCRQASERYKSLGVTYDKLFQDLSTLRDNEKLKSFSKWMYEFQEEYKDQEYKRLYESSMQMVKKRQMTLESAETWRMFMEASIDNAFVLAGENWKSGNLGRTEDHYARRIYDTCMGLR